MAINSLWCTPVDKRRVARQVALFGVLGSLMFAIKVAMMALPNIEPVSLLVMVYAVTMGKKCLFPIYIYVVLELLLYGIGIWSVGYLYVWAILALVAWLLRRMTSPLGWAVLAGGFGLLFGALFTPACLLFGGPAFALSWWLSGISFDLIHCVANFALALVLFVPLRRLMTRLLTGRI